MKLYKGEKEDNEAKVLVDGEPLRERTDITQRRGFNWGFGGGGSYHLATSLAADVFGDDFNNMPYCWAAIGIEEEIKGIQADSWILTEKEIREAGIKSMWKVSRKEEDKTKTRQMAAKYHVAIDLPAPPKLIKAVQ